jgi:hypothetical protein
MLGLRQIMFAVEDIDDPVARLRPRAELVGEVVQYEDKHMLCYAQGVPPKNRGRVVEALCTTGPKRRTLRQNRASAGTRTSAKEEHDHQRSPGRVTGCGVERRIARVAQSASAGLPGLRLDIQNGQ